ncbi:hypothetical protein T05_7377 [Trichinella murrelli]|uniref:Uncharacterized protein n=1 Tax=Trichinella murrelli TaxID=144512 RepID=A0A0V0UGS8_9BILA|nr:hypothetical protein T05_7377 [Trichinella murrelli]
MSYLISSSIAQQTAEQMNKHTDRERFICITNKHYYGNFALIFVISAVSSVQIFLTLCVDKQTLAQNSFETEIHKASFVDYAFILELRKIEQMMD